MFLIKLEISRELEEEEEIIFEENDFFPIYDPKSLYPLTCVCILDIVEVEGYADIRAHLNNLYIELEVSGFRDCREVIKSASFINISDVKWVKIV